MRDITIRRFESKQTPQLKDTKLLLGGGGNGGHGEAVTASDSDV